MDLLGEKPEFDLSDEKWRIFTRHETLAPQYVGDGASVANSIIAEGCEVFGTVENSVLFPGVKVMPGAVVRDSVVMGGCVIEADAVVSYSILDTNVKVGAGAVVGGAKGDEAGVAVIGDSEIIAPGQTVGAGEMIPDVRK